VGGWQVSGRGSKDGDHLVEVSVVKVVIKRGNSVFCRYLFLKMADTRVQKDCDSQHLSCQINVNSAIYCEKCVVLENQLHSAQEELKSAK
jgi:hypothetical protein